MYFQRLKKFFIINSTVKIYFKVAYYGLEKYKDNKFIVIKNDQIAFLIKIIFVITTSLLQFTVQITDQ